MSAPTPRPNTGHPGMRNQGFALAVAIAAAVIGAVIVQGTMYTAFLPDGEPTAAVVEPASTIPPPAPTEAPDAQCKADLRVALTDDTTEDLPPSCVALGGEGAQAALDAVAAELGVGPTTPAAVPPAPKGVTVSGDYASDITIRSFKAERDSLGDFAVTLRLKNTSSQSLEFVGVKVTALRGEAIVATADGLVESIAAGQTITTEPISTDDFPASAKGITYEVELGG